MKEKSEYWIELDKADPDTVHLYERWKERIFHSASMHIEALEGNIPEGQPSLRARFEQEDKIEIGIEVK